MGAKYRIVLPQTAVTAAVDLLELLSPTAKSIKLCRLRLWTKKTTTEMVRLTLKRVTGSPTSGSGGSTATPQGMSTLFSSPSVTAEIFNTTRISGGTSTTLMEESFNLAVGFEWVPSEIDEKDEHEGATRLVWGLEDAPAASTNFMGHAIVEVVG